ncbi:uncharacterized protein LOC132088078 [Daphnia carinata]|uniref:uncharacterized protein LOC132088078 n=1 Tax=Daphnia carinata TaxID=120202 RepID=UPI00286885D3|nr:uncharacterized protein LOC132088078 [Daphnia carinata]
MKDMSKLLPRVVLERVSVSRIAAPSELQLAEEHESSANHAKEELSRAEAASSLEQGGNATSAELGSLRPTDEDCMILDVFLSADKKEGDGRSKNTVIGQSATEPEIVSEESVTKEKSCIPENTRNAVAVDSLAVIVDVNLDICVDDGGHVEIQDVKITGRKRSGSRQEEKTSPKVKPLRGRRVRTPKAMAVEPVRKQERIAYSRRKLAEPSLDPLPSSNGTDVTEKSEATLSLGTTVKENVVHENAMAISEEKRSHVEEQEGPSASVAGLPDNIEIAKENDIDAGSSIANREEIKIVHLEEAALNEEKDLLTTVKPPKLRRGRGGRVKVAAREPTTGKIKSVVGQSSDGETTNCSAVSEQTNMEESPTSTVNTSRYTANATSSSEIKMNLNLFVQMTRVPEVEALAAALKLEGSKTSVKRPRRNVSDPSTSSGVELSAEFSSPELSLKRVRKKKKFF